MARSGIPSAFKSPAAIATGKLPTAMGEPDASVNEMLPLVSTAPRRMDTLFEVLLATAKSTSGKDGRFELLELRFKFRKLAVAIAIGPFSLTEVVFWSAKGEDGNWENPPLPLPLNTE